MTFPPCRLNWLKHIFWRTVSLAAVCAMRAVAAPAVVPITQTLFVVAKAPPTSASAAPKPTTRRVQPAHPRRFRLLGPLVLPPCTESPRQRHCCLMSQVQHHLQGWRPGGRDLEGIEVHSSACRPAAQHRSFSIPWPPGYTQHRDLAASQHPHKRQPRGFAAGEHWKEEELQLFPELGCRPARHPSATNQHRPRLNLQRQAWAMF